MKRLSQSRTNSFNLALVLVGVVLLMLALWADPLGLDMTPGFGLLQILGLLGSITLISGSCYWYLVRRYPLNGRQRSLLVDFGLRLWLTGLLMCSVTGLADMVGIGTHRGTAFERPFLGPLQLGGLLLGILGVGVGLLLYWLGSSGSTSEPEQN